jgi:hypothetical protein
MAEAKQSRTPPRLIGACPARHSIQYGEHVQPIQYVAFSTETGPIVGGGRIGVLPNSY